VNRIRILPDQVANQIAAGEVIERPASVLKELVENAIDAQATSIRIEIKGGGKSLIRVSDNGHGMNRDDALLCLERHATSKIHDSADIGSIHTLGFRGEAIPSIASVSRFRLLSREANSESGVEIDLNGGKLLNVKEAGCAVGTQVEVRSLFYNLPARRKFLRSDATELGHLHHVFLLHAIAQPQIAWILQQDDRIVHELAPSSSSSTDFQSALLGRIRMLHGPQLVSQLLPVSIRREGIHIQGFIGKPGLSRSNRSELYCYVNSRPVDSRAVYYGLIEGYHNALMRGRYPICFIFMEIDPASVDVNIHPAKREVRFREDARVQGTVIEAVRKALGTRSETSSSISPVAISFNPSAVRGSSQPFNGNSGPFTSPAPISSTPHQISLIQPSSTTQPAAARAFPNPFPSAPQETLPDPSSSLAILGVFANLYVIAIDPDGLIIVDQHAAHERILFEQMMSRLGQGAAPSQRLLLPQTIELSPRDATDLRSFLSTLEKMGFGIAEFGDRTFIIDAMPPSVSIQALTQLIRSIIDELREAGQGINRDRLAEEIVAKTVCRHAVKANDILRPEELYRMWADLQKCANPLTCPHGRPTILRLTQTELEKKFGRRPIESL
jgi:DNA mismatch repair protein MutL